MTIDSIRYASRFDGISGSAIREIFKLLAVPGMISFAGGNPAAAALPDAQCAELARELLLDKGKVLLQYGATGKPGALFEGPLFLHLRPGRNPARHRLHPGHGPAVQSPHRSRR